MEMFKNWVVGLDLSRTDDFLVKNVAAMARKFEPKTIKFIHVTSKLSIPKDVLSDIPDLNLPNILDNKSSIEKLINEHLDSSTSIAVEIKEGNPVTEILQVSNKELTDLIILGHKSQKNHGTIHKKLLRKAPCSVLFIPELVKESINSIVVPTDFSEHSSLAIDLGKVVANVFSARDLHVLHIYQDASKYLGQVFETVHEVNEILDKQKEIDTKLKTYATHKLNEYVDKFSDESSNFIPHIASIDRSQDVGSAVEEWVNKHSPDLVILGSKGENSAAATLLGSVSEHMNENDTEHLMIVIKRKGENKSLLKMLLGG